MTVRIKVLEFERNGRHLYRVTSIKGVLTKERLDSDYVVESPSFWLTQSRRTIKLFDGTTLSVNGEYKKSVFARILREIAKAGDRLHEMNREKYIRKITKNVHEIVSAREERQPAAEKVLVRSRTFKI